MIVLTIKYCTIIVFFGIAVTKMFSGIITCNWDALDATELDPLETGII